MQEDLLNIVLMWVSALGCAFYAGYLAGRRGVKDILKGISFEKGIDLSAKPAGKKRVSDVPVIHDKATDPFNKAIENLDRRPQDVRIPTIGIMR